jgi:A/G-specific adenine glycosylase
MAEPAFRREVGMKTTILAITAGALLLIPAAVGGLVSEAVGDAARAFAELASVTDDQITDFFERFAEALADSLLPAFNLPEMMPRYTQGLMDLGATVCSTRQPACLLCPLASVCVACAAGTPERFPVKTKRVKRGRRQHALLWLRRGEQLLLQQRPEKGVWAGLWSLPEFESAQVLQERVATWPGQGEWLPVIEHALTHFVWTLQPLVWTLPARAALPAGLPGAVREAGEGLETGDGEERGQGRWVSEDAALAMGLPAPIRRLLQR